ncbi:hypothetical protein E4U30_005721 [Claviceps sp. LM220 group G6]|nr:hypothetical protein E4U56_004442 [Claviceps arundinis]KAG6049096.1 hypothetical protein E4U17_006944 [Claviceps sp. LM77 group G4]KAG6051480.1 hypothetical protein E4U39_000877 [Claviceps sp. Clav50 group G5]KAG6099931.1 hypothetical protein E4U30_005721 [Claviceps sp. LM220 group G6]KAG6127585.1 hypothetical protein E4U12_005789 [Claviceps purpurea]KAG6304148.1 hypothetical protein E4U09_000057 [Claviceps aff. purpurea]
MMMPSRAHSSSGSSASSTSSWQDRLEEICRGAQLMPPVFQIVSDRRGGRTAWSSRVTVYGQTLAARYWYDGKNLNNAREDAAECAIKWLGTVNDQPRYRSWGTWY